MVQDFGFTPAELCKLRSLKDPYGIQRFLDLMPYHLGDTVRLTVTSVLSSRWPFGL